MREIARLDEVALQALGVDKVTSRAFSVILQKVGSVVDAPTLPETVAQTAENTANVVVLATTTEELQALALEPLRPDNALARRLGDIEMALERAQAGNGELLRALSDLRTEYERVTLDYQRLNRRFAELEAGNT